VFAIAALRHALDQTFDRGQIVLAEMLSQASGEEFSGQGKRYSIGLSTHPSVAAR